MVWTRLFGFWLREGVMFLYRITKCCSIIYQFPKGVSSPFLTQISPTPSLLLWGDCVAITLCHCERPKGACLHAVVPAFAEAASRRQALPRNDIATKSQGRGEGEGLTKRLLTDMSTIKFDEFREK